MIDTKQIAAVARTISQCFSDDALIKWLRPGCTPWSRYGVEQAWQRRRIRRAIFEGQVFRSNITGEAKAIPPPYTSPHTSLKETSLEVGQEDEDVGVAVMLYPPEERQSFSLLRLWQGLKIWILDRVAPIPGDGSKQEVGDFTEAYKLGR